jgi:hypothetical protein
MGIGQLGFKNLVFKRKFRFTFELQDICGKGTVPAHYVKVASRPNLEVEETEINYLNAKTWIPGKASWQTMEVTYLDVATADQAPLFNWLASVYNFTDPVNLEQGSQRGDYTATAILKMFDGCGALIETWTMQNVWPTGINFGEVDYSSSDICEISLTLRYSDVKYEPYCPAFEIKPCCTSCDPKPKQPAKAAAPVGGGDT